MNQNAEYRSGSWEAGQDGTIHGYAVVFDSRTVLYKDPETGLEYGEVIDRHALDGADMSDVVLRFDHQGHALARTRGGSLRLSVDAHGLRVDADMTLSDEARSFYQEVKNGLIDKMSFAFTVAPEGDSWDSTTRTRTVKHIARLFDVSLVTWPAYEQTQVSARSRFEALAEPERVEFRRAECRAIWADVERRMGAYVEPDEGPESYPTWEEAKERKRRHAFGPASTEYPYGPIRREMLLLRRKWAADQGSDVRAAKEMFEQYTALENQFKEARNKQQKIMDEMSAGGGRVIRTFEEFGCLRRKNNVEEMNIRTIYDNYMEKRAAGSTSTMSNVIPSTVLDSYVLEKAPGAFLMDASVTNIAHAGNLTIPVAGLQVVEKHTENQEITNGGFVPGKLTITHSEYAYNTGYSQVGMSVSAASFEAIVQQTLLGSMTKKMDGVCLDAVAALSYSDDTTAVNVADTAPTFAELVKLAGLLGADYIEGAKWYMAPSTYFTWMLGMVDSNKKPILDPSKPIEQQAPLGYGIRLDAQVPANVVYFGNGQRVHLNYAAAPSLVMWTNNETNTEMAGVRAVAGAAAEVGSFVKMYKG